MEIAAKAPPPETEYWRMSSPVSCARNPGKLIAGSPVNSVPTTATSALCVVEEKFELFEFSGGELIGHLAQLRARREECRAELIEVQNHDNQRPQRR